jgi:endonuclease-3 related protein
MHDTPAILRAIFDALYRAYGPQHWWPGESRIEIAVGAILTQNTNWTHVEKAMAYLRSAGLLDWKALREIDAAPLAELIRPCGYYRVKARRLKNFVEWLWRNCDGDLDALKQKNLAVAREALLSVNGIGPETADSILLYAVGHATFVVDAYTARVARRHRLIDEAAGYDALKSVFEDNLESDAEVYNEYHALLVAVGKRHCRPRARCEGCPLEGFDHDSDA